MLSEERALRRDEGSRDRKKRPQGGKSMTRALKIENLTEIDKTSAQILREISLHLGEKKSAHVDYNLIAKSLNIDRSVVRSAVNRMIKNKILAKRNGELSILNAVLVE